MDAETLKEVQGWSVPSRVRDAFGELDAQIADLQRQLREAQEERDGERLRRVAFQRWFEAAVKHHNDLVAERDAAQAQIGDMAVELTDMRRERDAAEALAHRRLVLLCNVQSHTTVSADIIRMIDMGAEAPVLPAEAQAQKGEEHDHQMGEVAMAQGDEPADPGLA